MDPNTYAFFPETTICLPTATGEITSVYTLQLREPINHLLAGVYTVTMIQDGITYSSDVTVGVLDCSVIKHVMYRVA